MHDRMAPLMMALVEDYPQNRWHHFAWRAIMKDARLFAERFDEPKFNNCIHTVDGILALFIKSTLEQKIRIENTGFALEHLILSEVLFERLQQIDPYSSVYRTLKIRSGMPRISVSKKFAANHFATYTYEHVPAQFLSYAAIRYHMELPYYF